MLQWSICHQTSSVCFVFCLALLSRQCKIVDRSYILWIYSISPRRSRSDSWRMCFTLLSPSARPSTDWRYTAHSLYVAVYAIALTLIYAIILVGRVIAVSHAGAPLDGFRCWQYQMKPNSKCLQRSKRVHFTDSFCDQWSACSHIARKRTECVDMRFAIFTQNLRCSLKDLACVKW